jgi:hypothetical protein
MGESFTGGIATAIRKQGIALHRGAINCTAIHSIIARAIWPRKTAEHWAAAAGIKPRMAKYWLAGTHEVSDAGKLAIIREID